MENISLITNKYNNSHQKYEAANLKSVLISEITYDFQLVRLILELNKHKN